MSPAVGPVSVSLRGEDGVVRESKWAAGAPALGIARTVPWRTFRWRHGQRHYSGTYWWSVMSGHVIDESRLDLTEAHKLARTDGTSAAAIARRLGTTSDAIQALLLDHPAPADPAGGARRRRARYDISREQLRDLHHEQGLSFTEIGQRTGYSTTAIRDLARTYGMPVGTSAEGRAPSRQ